MKTESTNSDQTAQSLEMIRQEVARLSARVAMLERGSEAKLATPIAPTAHSDERLSEEILFVIAAAVAAFLGKTPHIRQVRLFGTNSWSQQGRATIQASHARGV
jgi:methylmalonyl-CoA carboxyltransferase large subunit